MNTLLRGTSAMVLVFLSFGCEVVSSVDRDKVDGAAGSTDLPDASDDSQPDAKEPDAPLGPETGESAVASCTNNIQDGEETAVDCGGKCLTRCDDGASCKVGDDCKNGVCKGGQCKAPSCNDGVGNGTETDLDCGGSCVTKCGPLKGCATPSDCLDGVCTDGKCAAPGCTDKTQNGQEADVDCGGPECDRCADASKCTADADCLSGFCDPTAQVCNAADCGNGHQDANETDLDCGAACPVQCAVGKGCASGNDCAEKVCDTNANPPVCVAASCTDQVQNGDESDLDCGGSCAEKCDDGRKCLVAGDCASGHPCDPATLTCVQCTAAEHCPAGFVCTASSCACDGDGDCGNGGTCTGESRCQCGNTSCAPGELCMTASTCGK